MIISRTPFRISFAGGGSDLKDYYGKYGGSVLSMSINKYMYLSMHQYFNDDKYFLKYSKNEFVDAVDEISHPIIKQVYKDYNIKGVDFNSSADIPSGTGLASSSAFTVGLTTLCNAYTNKYMSKEEIAAYACEVEIEKLKEPIGKQDQYGCAIGGIKFIQFFENDQVGVEQVLLSKEKTQQLNENLVLLYLGSQRKTSSILSEQKKNMQTSQKKIDNLHKMVRLSKNLKTEFNHGNIDALGEILHQGWMYKKELASKISNEQIDHYYNTALNNGASGGKLLGAGGGGFLLFYVQKENQKKMLKALNDLKRIDFDIDFEGSKIVYFNE